MDENPLEYLFFRKGANEIVRLFCHKDEVDKLYSNKNMPVFNRVYVFFHPISTYSMAISLRNQYFNRTLKKEMFLPVGCDKQHNKSRPYQMYYIREKLYTRIFYYITESRKYVLQDNMYSHAPYAPSST